ncbi:hypothetical protein H0H93_013373 [Arthromyces matolae]|nr:hypothetical protein H0H93_013373 [Arthromyces matolae]
MIPPSISQHSESISDGDANIDPVLRDDQYAQFQPRITNGTLMHKHAFAAHLETVKRRGPLQDACAHFGIVHAKQANLKKLRASIVGHWYAQCSKATVVESQPTTPSHSPITPPQSSLATRSPPLAQCSQSSVDGELGSPTEDEIISQYGAEEVALGSFDSGCMENADEDEEGDDEEDEDVSLGLKDDTIYERFKRQARIDAAQDYEGNRRAGGLKTQKCVIKSWKLFVQQALEKGEIRDDIVDEHSLILFLNFSAARCARNRRGEDIPNSRIGASQIKKEFFGALRIRSQQDAEDPTLASRRPAATIYVYQLAKTRMDEALKNSYVGLVADDDAPDVVANTFLAQLSEEALDRIGDGFLSHRELKSAINGHLAWNMMNASGNRGDDIRALRLCEMQPYTFLHPNGETDVPAVLGLQTAHKASLRGMKTTVNPTYTCFIAARDPVKCPLGAFALYLHFIHDYAKIDEKYDIDYMINKSWRSVFLIHGASAVVPYNEHALQNLFVLAYKKAGIDSRLKAHLARHMLGYLQEKMGVNANDTAKLGWSRDTYNNTYAPALPKPAILGAHGYKVHENYDPRWRHIQVPEAFLSAVCPMAETNVKLVKDKRNLVGATNYWEMIISLRPYVFQCAAAIFQKAPQSAIFRLPALARDDVKLWMSTVFPSQLAVLNAEAGDPIDLARLENTILRSALEELRHLSSLQTTQLQAQAKQLAELTASFNRRTVQWTPPKANVFQPPSTSAAAFSARSLSFLPTIISPKTVASSQHINLQPAAIIDDTILSAQKPQRPSTVPNEEASPPPLQEFIPCHVLELVLPPAIAFCVPAYVHEGEDLLSHPPLPRNSGTTWPSVFIAIKQPHALWDSWKPSKSLDQMTVADIWNCYNIGETLYNDMGVPIGLKPPLRLVEQHFKSEWRPTPSARKAWQRFREIPEWIDTSMKERGITPSVAISELEKMQRPSGRTSMLGTSALSLLLANDRKAAAKSSPATATRDYLFFFKHHFHMSINSLWNTMKEARTSISFLDLCIREMLERKQLGARPFIVGVDMNHFFDNGAAGAHNHIHGQSGVENHKLEIFFDRLCEYLTVPAVFIFVSNGKKELATAREPLRFREYVEGLLNAFGYRFHQAPGDLEAVAELARLNSEGSIDVIITDDSNSLVYGAQKVICRCNEDNIDEYYAYDLNIIISQINDQFPHCDIRGLHAASEISATQSSEKNNWIHREPVIREITFFCIKHFRWSVKKMCSVFRSKLWYGILVSMLYSKYKIYCKEEKKLLTPNVGTSISVKHEPTDGEVRHSPCYEVTFSTSSFVEAMEIESVTKGSDHLTAYVPVGLLQTCVAQHDFKTQHGVSSEGASRSALVPSTSLPKAGASKALPSIRHLNLLDLTVPPCDEKKLDPKGKTKASDERITRSVKQTKVELIDLTNDVDSE